MPTKVKTWQMPARQLRGWQGFGNNNQVDIRFKGIDALRDKLLRMHRNVSGTLLEGALRKGAQVYKSAIEEATPTSTSDRHRYKHGHPPGQARKAVIIYKRKPGRVWSFQIQDLGLLVGYAKRKGYYMYWQEYGWTTASGRRVSGQPRIRGAIRRVDRQAYKAAEQVLRAGMLKEAV
jgi:HK97 gp10 family phage protein